MSEFDKYLNTVDAMEANGGASVCPMANDDIDLAVQWLKTEYPDVVADMPDDLIKKEVIEYAINNHITSFNHMKVNEYDLLDALRDADAQHRRGVNSRLDPEDREHGRDGEFRR